MKRINLDLFELQVFLRVAELGSFRLAAEDVGLSGPALSRMIARTEARLGARLFDRDTRNVRLTPQGQTLRGVAQRILSETESALTAYRGYLEAERGRVTLAGLPSVTAGLLPDVIAKFMEQRPEVDIHITDALSDGVVSAVLEGRADLGFAAGLTEGTEGLSFRPLLEDRFVAIGGADYLTEDRPYRWAELIRQPFVAMAPGTSVRTLSEAAAVQAGVMLTPRFEVSHLATAGALVAAGLGVGALPLLTLPVLGRAPHRVRPLEDPVMIRRIGVVWAAGTTLSPAAQAFRELVCGMYG